MTIQSANLGFPRIGAKRQLKKATEKYWRGDIDQAELLKVASELRQGNWKMQQDAGIEVIPSNDFSLYDQVLDMAATVGAVPERFGSFGSSVDLDTYFAMARGNKDAAAMEMTKWFDTNYHYIVPEFEADQTFSLTSSKAVDEFKEAQSMGIETRPVLIGPISFLGLGKGRDPDFDPLDLLESLLPVYEELLGRLSEAGASWVQLDEPILGLDLTDAQRSAMHRACEVLKKSGPRLLVASYFAGPGDNLDTLTGLNIDGIHLDLVRAPETLDLLAEKLPQDRLVSLGVINGRNVWRADLDERLETLQRAQQVLGDRPIQIAPSCSLLHCPIDLELETGLDGELKSWLAFSKQKLGELDALCKALTGKSEQVSERFEASRQAVASRRKSRKTTNQDVRSRVSAVSDDDLQRDNPYAVRQEVQRRRLDLPKYPTTSIGSFPQTTEVRKLRAAHRRGDLDAASYRQALREETEKAIRTQEELGLDVLVHGEFERNDMVEYFGEKLEGFAFSKHAWVQSYGSRYVKPPIIFGDVQRPEPMTVEWSTYAQSLTERPVKGMLTGPVTIVEWSFVRDDQPRSETCRQVALAIRDEAKDLEAAGIGVIQIDEPALREGLPLRRSDWSDYLAWAIDCFRLASTVVDDATQVHTHMCYAEFNDIMDSIASLDADVISIESSRSRMELLDSFVDFRYPNEIGPGVWDIHSPRVPSADEITDLLEKAASRIDPDRLWVNPDCGLKTRDWEETRASLQNMVAASRQLRQHAA